MKSGIDFFPLDVSLDEKFELIEAEFGLTGFAVIVKLFQRIYGQQGYYCEWTNEVALLFGRYCGLGGNVVSEIVSAAIKRGIFDKTLYDRYHILTSKGIQDRYFEAVSRRKNVEVKKQYLLISDTKKSGNANIIEKNADISGENADISKQSRVEKSRVEESIEKGVATNKEDAFASYARDNKELLSALNDFRKMRKAQKSPMTAKAETLLLSELKKLSADPEEQIAIINQSIMNSWKSVYPLRGDNAKCKIKPNKETSFDLDAYTDMVKAYRPKFEKKE